MATAVARRPKEQAGDRSYRAAAAAAANSGSGFAMENTQMAAADRAVGMARKSLIAYGIATYPKFKTGWHLRAIANALERVARGETKRLLIECPPRHGKSFLTSELFPAWYLGQHPDHPVIFATYGQEFADRFGRRVLEQIENPLYQAIFPDAAKKLRGSTQSGFEMGKGGEYRAVGAGGSLTGRGASLLILDDLIKNNAEAESEVFRERLWEWYESTARTRLMPGGAVVSIQTRWNIDDFTGRLRSLHSKEGWEIITFPAILDDGSALWPEQFPLADLEQTRESIDPKMWWSLYMQKPTVADGAIFKREDFWSFEQMPKGFQYIVQAWDTAFGTKTINDYSVCQTWMVCQDGYYLIDQWRGRIGYDALFEKAQELAKRYNPRAVVIEKAASGHSLIQSLQQRTKLPVMGLQPWNDKKKRQGYVLERDEMHGAAALSSLIKTGKIKIPKGAPWTREFVDEFCAFDGGNSGHDDQVKAAIVFASYITHNGIPNFGSYRGTRPVSRPLF